MTTSSSERGVSLGMPGFLAGPVIAIELVGGLLILAGIYARPVAVLMIPVMIGAMSAHIGNGWVFSVPGGGWEYPLFLIVVSAVVGLAGEGAFARVDCTADLGNARREDM